MSKSFGEKVDELQSHLSSVTVKASNKEKCMPTMLIVGVAIPILLWLVLYFLQPSFVQKKEGSTYTRDNAKILWWTAGVTVASWAGLYLYTRSSGYSKSAMICAKK